MEALARAGTSGDLGRCSRTGVLSGSGKPRLTTGDNQGSTQNVNFIWARQCAAILEIYPEAYFIPGEYLQLVRAVGAIPFAAYEGDHPYEDSQRSTEDAGLRFRSRAAVFKSFDIRAAEQALNEMLRARSSCLKNLLKEVVL